MKRIAECVCVIVSLVLLSLLPVQVYGSNEYGKGVYGSCTYATCGISLVSDISISTNVTPGASTTCTVARNNVSVTTGSSTGYTVTLTDVDTSNNMTRSGGGTIPAVNGTAASPGTLNANSWGYRVDGAAGFGTGPTSAVSNAGVPSLTFAAVPLSSATPDVVMTSTSAATAGDSASVWYGTCVNANQPSGTYTDSVIYTAVTN